MSLPDILRDIDLKDVDGVAEDKENAASEAPIVEKVTMPPHIIAVVSLFKNLFLNTKIEFKIVCTLRIPFSHTMYAYTIVML